MYIDNIFASQNFKNEYNGYSESLQNEYKEAQNISTSAISMWMERWFLSSNAKDIGTLYLIFALFSGLIGTAFSVLIRLELSGPGVQYIADNQLYNSIITAHAIIMIFFMVEKGFNMLNMKLQPSLLRYMINDNNVVKIGYDNNNIVKIGSDINNNDNYKKPKHKYVKILVDNPFNNRDIILKVTKKQKGVYIWESLDDKHKYVGHSINLYNRISSYFMPSILKTKARRVLRYLNKHGFNDMKLTIYIMDENSNLEQVVELEQHFIDNLKPNLNVDLLASSSGYHEPMAQEIRAKLCKQRGIPVYIYKADDFSLLYVFESKQYMFDSINIHHNTLNDCLNLGTLYLDTFFFSLDLIEESTKTNILTLDEIKNLVNDKRDVYNVKHPAAKAILAEFKDDSRKNLVFSSLNSLAKHLKGDRQVIRDYLTGKKSGYYRGKWKFTYQN
jgi:GIY-YIG catalytic domain/Cytochrome C and Quinol oxidase polypeptide I/NUMOD1 domain